MKVCVAIAGSAKDERLIQEAIDKITASNNKLKINLLCAIIKKKPHGKHARSAQEYAKFALELCPGAEFGLGISAGKGKDGIYVATVAVRERSGGAYTTNCIRQKMPRRGRRIFEGGRLCATTNMIDSIALAITTHIL